MGITSDCPVWEEESQRSKPKREHKQCRCVRSFGLQARLEVHEDHSLSPSSHPSLSSHPEGEGATAGLVAVVSLSLHEGAFELDKRIDRWRNEGERSGVFVDQEDFEAARAGERPAEARDVNKALLRLLSQMAKTEGSGLSFGPDCCLHTMNRFGGVAKEDVVEQGGVEGGGGGCSEFAPLHLLQSVSCVEAEAPLLGGAALGGLRPQCMLHKYQLEGISWMAEREAHPDRLSLHPAWLRKLSPVSESQTPILLLDKQ